LPRLLYPPPLPPAAGRSDTFDTGQFFQRLPPLLGLLQPHLLDLRVENNDIHFPPHGICERGGRHVLRFLHDRIVCRGKLFTGSGDYAARMWDMSDIEGATEELAEYEGHTDVVTCCQAVMRMPWPSANDKHTKRDIVFTGSYDQTARAWDATTGEVAREYKYVAGGERRAACHAASAVLLCRAPC
jgi:WD40 repeat protein